ncbi:hypothetical protein COU59_02920 [Candidatus Pacearchaeota archaeon CG10_big_fil_rev_8_21_14_0_10_34_12]|nr:MAG: hypothetical protein COU59_02920 [Candidatus Pacearchaeota archaeon CG10_big_fil_rev_8_21_14_0_10_34_12]
MKKKLSKKKISAEKTGKGSLKKSDEKDSEKPRKKEVKNLTDESSLEKIIEEEIDEKEDEFISPVSSSNARAPILEQVAIVEEPINLGRFFALQRGGSEENAEYKSGRDVDYIGRNEDAGVGRETQYSERTPDYNSMLQEERFRQTEKIIEKTGEKPQEIGRGEEWEVQKTSEIDTEDRRKTQIYMNKGDYK